jgi:hypothetical protein
MEGEAEAWHFGMTGLLWLWLCVIVLLLHKIAVTAPDASPSGLNVEGEAEAWDFGVRGVLLFCVDALLSLLCFNPAAVQLSKHCCRLVYAYNACDTSPSCPKSCAAGMKPQARQVGAVSACIPAYLLWGCFRC